MHLLSPGDHLGFPACVLPLPCPGSSFSHDRTVLNLLDCFFTLVKVITRAQEDGQSLCFLLGTKSCCPKFWTHQDLQQPAQMKRGTNCPLDYPDIAVECILFQR